MARPEHADLKTTEMRWALPFFRHFNLLPSNRICRYCFQISPAVLRQNSSAITIGTLHFLFHLQQVNRQKDNENSEPLP